jgi:hypothetical protein
VSSHICIVQQVVENNVHELTMWDVANVGTCSPRQVDPTGSGKSANKFNVG